MVRGAKFITTLVAEFPERGRRRTLYCDLVYFSPLLGYTVTIPAGFPTDFASVPRLPFAFLLAGDTGHYAAVVHDWIYSGRFAACRSRRLADDVLVEALAATGVPVWRRGLMWWAVRIFGWRAWRRGQA